VDQTVPYPRGVRVRRATIDELLGLLRFGDFGSILGVREDVRIEFKRELNLKLDSEKHKLAKTVAAFANSGGGMLLVGVSSDRDPTTRSDYASELVYVPFPDEGGYYKALNDLLYPQIKVTIETFGSAPNCLLAVSVVSADLESPILVTKTVDEDLKGGSIFGYYKRTEIESAHVKCAEVHALIQAGQKLNQIGNLQNWMDGIAVQLADIQDQLKGLSERKDQ